MTKPFTVKDARQLLAILIKENNPSNKTLIDFYTKKIEEITKEVIGIYNHKN